MRSLILFVMLVVPLTASADSLTRKYHAIKYSNEARAKILAQKEQESQVRMSQFRVNAMGAWKTQLRVPTTSNAGIEILPYRVDKSPS